MNENLYYIRLFTHMFRFMQFLTANAAAGVLAWGCPSGYIYRN
jgi:hypothetical protein